MKNEMRKAYLEKRNAMTNAQQLEKSQIIFQKLINSYEYKNADWIFTYINISSEVKTIPFIEKAWSDNKRVAVPIAKANRLMYFVEITSFDGMNCSHFGVMEPNIPLDKQVFPNEKTMFIVPGSIFDEDKNRCGYGGGYYDTYTEENQVNNTIGVCYDVQVAKKIPTEKFDRKLRKIITEKRIIE